MAKEEEKVEKKQERYDLVEVPTETAIMIRDNNRAEGENILQDKQVLAEILNGINDLKKELLK